MRLEAVVHRSRQRTRKVDLDASWARSRIDYDVRCCKKDGGDEGQGSSEEAELDRSGGGCHQTFLSWRAPSDWVSRRGTGARGSVGTAAAPHGTSDVCHQRDLTLTVQEGIEYASLQATKLVARPETSKRAL